MEGLAKIRLDARAEVFSRESIFLDAQTRFRVVYEFCRGDLSQDIYAELIHNQNNMRPQELNGLFSLSGLKNACLRSSGEASLSEFLGESDPAKANGLLVAQLEDFFERRNKVAHSLNSMTSSGTEQIERDIDLLRAFGRSLCAMLESEAPSSILEDTASPPRRSAPRLVASAIRTGAERILSAIFRT